MPSKIIIAKNVTGSPVTITDWGLTIQAGQQSTLTSYYRLEEIWECVSLATLVTAGTIVINDGTSDLSVAAGLLYISPVITDRDLDQEVDVTYTSGVGNNRTGVARWTNDGYLGGIIPDAHAARHRPGGLDGLPTGVAVGIGQGNLEGTAQTFARSDHGHRLKDSNGNEFTLGSVPDGYFLIRNGSVLAGSPGLSASGIFPSGGTNPIGASDGNMYYNTTLKEWMVYDAARGLWLSQNSITIPFGRSGNVQPGTYYRTPADVTSYSDLDGFLPLQNGAVVGVSYTRRSIGAHVYEITANGVTAGSFTSSNLQDHAPANFTALFNAHQVIGVRSGATSVTATQTVGFFYVKWRS